MKDLKSLRSKYKALRLARGTKSASQFQNMSINELILAADTAARKAGRSLEMGKLRNKYGVRSSKDAQRLKGPNKEWLRNDLIAFLESLQG